MRRRLWLRAAAIASSTAGALSLSGVAAAAGQTNLNETAPLVDAMFILSMIGALITFFVLVWALWKFRDPTTKGRRYG